jgi:hypothetical protein
VSEEDHKALLAKFEAELDEAKADVAAALARRDSLIQVVAGLRKLISPSSDLVIAATQRLPGLGELVNGDKRLSAPGPRGREAVRILLQEAYPKPLHITEMAQLAADRGWMGDVESRRNALNAAAKRLVQDKEIERGSRRATFRWIQAGDR